LASIFGFFYSVNSLPILCDIKDLETKMKRQAQDKEPKAAEKDGSADTSAAEKKFKDLESRIGKLKVLEKRMASLDLDGFRKEAESIKGKLKDPMAAEAVEKELRALEAKIKERRQQSQVSTAPAEAESTVKKDREFKDLERSIALSKELEKRLAALPLDGFEDEAKSIRAKLKDPTAVGKAEKELKLLETKIKKLHDQQTKQTVKTVQLAEVEAVGKIDKEFKELERRIEKLRKLERRLDSLELEGFAEETKALKAKLKDPSLLSSVERELGILETRAQQLAQSKSAADKLMTSATELCNEAAEVFHSKDYGKARKLYTRAIEEFVRAKRYVPDDKDLTESINDNMASAESNIIACDIGLGSVRADEAREHYKAARWLEAIKEYQAASSYFEAASDEARRRKDEGKLSDADKLVNLMSRNIEECRTAMARDEILGLSQKIEMLLAETRELAERRHFRAGLETLSKAESMCGQAMDLAQAKGFAKEAKEIKAYTATIDKLTEEIQSLRARTAILDELKTRLDSLDSESFEEEIHALKERLTEPTALEKLDKLEGELQALETKIQQQSAWKTKGAGLFEAAIELCNQATQSFYEKHYHEALQSFSEATTHLIEAKKHAGDDEQLLGSIDDNIILARKNIAACNMGIGAMRAEVAQRDFDTGNYEKALEEFQAALGFFQNAQEEAQGVKDRDKMRSAGKLIAITTDNVSNCEMALDKAEVDHMIDKIRSLVEEGRVLGTKRDLEGARDKLSEAEMTCREALDLAQTRDFTDAAESVEELLRNIKSKMGSLGKEPLPRIEEVQIEITIDEPEPS
jgi:hypothetical protein